MIREIVKIKDEFYKIRIPKEYINKKVEILVLPFEESSASKILKKTFGILEEKNVDPIKWQEDMRVDREI